MTEIAVYIEGGGKTAGEKAELRLGFDALFMSEKSKAREKRASLRFICCGGRQQAYEAFINALAVNPETINALLVDSETSVAAVPVHKAQDAAIRVAHLHTKTGTEGRGQGDGWDFTGVASDRVHLMVQCMEAWIVADPDALEEFYKQKFNRDALPKQTNLETAQKSDIYHKLERATKDTQKGEYGKIKHASKLLEKISSDKVASRCPRFKIFREWLTESI
ncbi:MAG: DUF4276 family protein [Puia sp.]|nr:DUF4276 family protein [Puia sp.]